MQHFNPIRCGLALCSISLALSHAELANAQSLTGNVGSANITEGDRSVEARIGTDEAGTIQSRVHVEQSFAGWYKLRLIAGFSKPEEGDWDYSGVTAENWFQWASESKTGEGFNGGLRLSYTVSNGDRPDSAAVRMTLTDKFADAWEWRANAIAGVEANEGSEGGIELESRLQLTRGVPVGWLGSNNWRLGGELFSEYGNTRDLPRFSEQAHQVGPVIKAEWSNGISLQSAVRFGATDGADDVMAKIFIAKEL